MTTTRRDFLIAGTALTVAAALPRAAAAHDAGYAPKPGAWRSFEITTRVELAQPQGVSQAWVPLPSVQAPDWFKPVHNEWRGNPQSAVLYRDPKYGAELVHASWAAGEMAPM